MEYNISHASLVIIAIVSVVTLALTLFATVNICLSMWFRFWSSKEMDDRTKREFYVQNKYDIKWSLSLAFVALGGALIFGLLGIRQLSTLNLRVALLFFILFWGSYRTLNAEKKRLEKKRNFGA